MNTALFRLIVSLTLFLHYGLGENDYDGPLTIKLYHILSGDDCEDNWNPSTQINIQNANTGSVNVKLTDWNETASKQLLELGLKDKLYKMKVLVITSKGREIEFRTFIKARKLIEENVTVTLVVSLDYTGSVMGVTLKATSPPSTNDNVVISSSPVIYPSVIIRSVEVGPVPDTATYIQKLEREREAKERGGNQDNRSFFAKYWMYIVLLVVFGVLSGATNGDAGQTGR